MSDHRGSHRLRLPPSIGPGPRLPLVCPLILESALTRSLAGNLKGGVIVIMTTQDGPPRRSRRAGWVNALAAGSFGSEHFDTRPFLKIRRGYLDVLAAGHRKNIIHGLIEIDVTDLQRVLREREAIGEPLSFTAALMHAVARAVDEDRILHAYRRRNRIILFDDVDINTQIEVDVSGQKIVQSLLIRAANREERRATFSRDPVRTTGERRRRATLSGDIGIYQHSRPNPGPAVEGGDVEPALVQAFRRDSRHELNRNVRPRWRLGHPDRPSDLDDHGRRDRDQTAIYRRQPAARARCST